MRLFRKKESVVVERRQRFSYLVPTWFRSQERCGSKEDINAPDVDGMTRLHSAVLKGCSSTVQKLLQEGADVNSRISIHASDAGYTPLHCAVREGNADIVKLLLKNNAQVDSRSNCGLTPLHVAAQRGNVPIAEILLNHGASIYSERSRDCERYIPLHFALKERHLGMVKLLLTAEATRASSETQTKYSETTIRLTSRADDHTISAYVFASHVDFHKKGNRTFLLDAVNGSEMEYTNIASRVSRWIFSELDRIDCELLLPALLHSAVEIGYVKIVKDFLKWGVDVHSLHHPLHPKHADDELCGFTLLHTAAKSSHVDMVKLLTSYGADVNVKDSDQRSPIFFAIEGLDVKMTKLLLSYGANIDADSS